MNERKPAYPKMNERTIKSDTLKKTRPNWMKITNNKKEQNNNHKIHKTNETLNEDK